MNANSLEKQCDVVLNVKLQGKVTFKTCYLLLELFYTALAWNGTIKMACFAQNFCII